MKWKPHGILELTIDFDNIDAFAKFPMETMVKELDKGASVSEVLEVVTKMFNAASDAKLADMHGKLTSRIVKEDS